jgi:hypothetical protein
MRILVQKLAWSSNFVQNIAQIIKENLLILSDII